MSKVTIREWYERTNAEWDEAAKTCGGTLPIPSPDEAMRGARKLFRFATGRTIERCELTSGNRYTWAYRGVLRVNPDRCESVGRGWQSIVHDISHYAHRRINRGTKPHCKAQALLEARMIREVVKRGFLVGSLARVSATAEEIEEPASMALPATHLIKQQRTAAKLSALEEREKKWDAKLRRAENALKKLRKQIAYYRRKQA